MIGDKVPTISLEEQLATFINTFQNKHFLVIDADEVLQENLKVIHNFHANFSPITYTVCSTSSLKVIAALF